MGETSEGARRRSIYEALHVILDRLEDQNVDPTEIASAVSGLNQDARTALAVVGWAATPLTEGAMIRRVAGLTRESLGVPGLEAQCIANPRPGGDDAWRVAEPGVRSFGEWCNSELRAWVSALDAVAEALEFGESPEDVGGPVDTDDSFDEDEFDADEFDADEFDVQQDDVHGANEWSSLQLEEQYAALLEQARRAVAKNDAELDLVKLELDQLDAEIPVLRAHVVPRAPSRGGFGGANDT